jgi:hypothetical protein
VAFTLDDTLSSLIDETITDLQGFGTDNDSVATLTQDSTEGSLTLTVDDTDDIGRGIIEIDDEIIYVNTTDASTVYVPPWGRGYKGTTAEVHLAGSPVWIAPTWPRSVVAREVNNTIRALYPDLFAVQSYEFQASDSVSWQYQLPANVERVLSVEWRWNLPESWNLVRAWELAYSSSPSDFPTGKSLLIGDPLPLSCTVRVVYATPPTLLSSSDQAFSDTGLPTSSRDLVVLGAAARLVPWQDTARLPVESVPSDALDQTKPVGNASTVSQYLRQLYTLKLQSEVRAQQDRYPSRSHRVR